LVLTNARYLLESYLLKSSLHTVANVLPTIYQPHGLSSRQSIYPYYPFICIPLWACDNYKTMILVASM
jgi:hypothetical protein